MLFTTSFALVPDRAWPMFERAIKVQVGTLLALVLLYRKDHVLALMWVVAGSIGFYAIKGGIFTIATLGQYRVWGPEDSFIADNNAFGLATVMSIPLWAYLYTQYRERPWIRVARDFRGAAFGRFRHRKSLARCSRRDLCHGRLPLAEEQEEACTRHFHPDRCD